jgi:UPF0716 protein FxsA
VDVLLFAKGSSVFLRLLFLFTLVPVVELALLIEVGSYFGVLPTVVLVIGTGVVGAALARWQGMQALGRLQGALRQGTSPGEDIFNGVLILGGGLLLLTPGLITDCFGFAALVPGSRNLIKIYLKRVVGQRMKTGNMYANYKVE